METTQRGGPDATVCGGAHRIWKHIPTGRSEKLSRARSSNISSPSILKSQAKYFSQQRLTHKLTRRSVDIDNVETRFVIG